jgi:hypothetical protein
MYCYKCGQEINDNLSYCQHCGEKINKESETNKGTSVENSDSRNKKVYNLKGIRKFIVGVVILVMIGLGYVIVNNNKIKPVSKHELESIDISRYFPQQIGTKKYYKIVGDTGVPLYTGKEEIIDSEMYKDGSNVIIKDYSPLLDGELLGSNLYQVNNDKIIILDSTISSGLKESTILSKEPVREYQEKIEYVTSIDKTIETEAGIFKNCIEITTQNITGDKGMDRLYLKSYYAPNLGKVLEIVIDNVKSDNISNTMYELTEYELPNNKDNYTYKNNEDKAKEVENINKESISITNNNLEIIVEDTEFDFSMKLPESWRGKYTISKESTSKYNIDLGNTYRKTLDFLYTPKGLEPQYMFSLVVFDTDMLEGVVEEQVKEIKEGAVIVNDEFYVECFTVPEPTQEIANNEELLSEMMVMVNEDLPKILKTVKFSK